MSSEETSTCPAEGMRVMRSHGNHLGHLYPLDVSRGEVGLGHKIQTARRNIRAVAWARRLASSSLAPSSPLWWSGAGN